MDAEGLRDGSSVLDAGCGPGGTACFLQACGLRCTGVDWHPGEGREVPARDAVLPPEGVPAFVSADLHSLPFAAGVFDACFAECVLSLVKDPEAVLAELCRVLRPEGLLLVTDLTLRRGAVPDRPSPASGFLVRGGSCLAGAVTSGMWKDRFETAGFGVLRAEDHSRELAALMAQLVWHDAAQNLAWLMPGGCSSGASSDRRSYGYGLFLARRRG